MCLQVMALIAYFSDRHSSHQPCVEEHRLASSVLSRHTLLEHMNSSQDDYRQSIAVYVHHKLRVPEPSMITHQAWHLLHHCSVRPVCCLVNLDDKPSRVGRLQSAVVQPNSPRILPKLCRSTAGRHFSTILPLLTCFPLATPLSTLSYRACITGALYLPFPLTKLLMQPGFAMKQEPPATRDGFPMTMIYRK